MFMRLTVTDRQPNISEHRRGITDAEGTSQIMAKRLLAIVASVFAAGVGQSQAGTIQSFTGDLRTDATFISCGSGCTLGAGNSDSDYAQWAAVERDFTVAASSMVQAITFSYGGGTNGNGLAIGPGGFEPYLSLFDASGSFLASTLFGITCPPGANKKPVPANASMCCSTQVFSGPAITPLPLAHSRICRLPRTRVWAVWRTDLRELATWLPVRICTTHLT